MHITSLRKVGGSVMLAVPPACRCSWSRKAGGTVGLAVDHGCLIVNPKPRPRYTLDELLAQCDANAELSVEDKAWLDGPAVGGELL